MAIIRTIPEVKTTEEVIAKLSPYFRIYQEVDGIHSVTNRGKRIDAVMVPKQIILDSGFPQIPVGLELKCLGLADGNKKQIIEISKQAIDYRYTRFKMSSGYHFLPLIIIYPSSIYYLSNSDPDRKEFNDGFSYLVTRLLGKWFIGELLFDHEGADWTILLCATKYFRWKHGNGKRFNMNWGFEKYEEAKGDLRSRKLSREEYEQSILEYASLIGI